MSKPVNDQTLLTYDNVLAIVNGALKCVIREHKLKENIPIRETGSISKRAASQIYNDLLRLNLNTPENQELICKKHQEIVLDKDESYRLNNIIADLRLQRDNLLKKLGYH